jgi:hypothetical protein
MTLSNKRRVEGPALQQGNRGSVKKIETAINVAYVVSRCRTCRVSDPHIRRGNKSMSSGFPRVYTSFAEFEREELRRLETMHSSVDDLMEERFADDADFARSETPRRRGRPRKHPR